MDVSYLRGSCHRYDAQRGRVRLGILTRRLLHEAYEFEAGAGLALAKAIDGEGNMTSFKYADPLHRLELRDILPDGFVDPFAERCRDATEIVNPLGGVRCIA